MKRITIILFATLLLASCGRSFKSKPMEQDVTAAVTFCAPPPPEEAKFKDATEGSYRVETASMEAAGNGYAEKNAEESISTIPVAQSRVETKIPSKIIRNAHINFQVDSTDRSHAHIVQLLAQYQAYFGTDNRVQYDGQIQQNMIIRVPSEHFDPLLEALMKESIFTNSKNISADDVTSEFVDIEARLKSKKEVEKRYMELLARAQKVTDVIEVESNLRIIREEIESTEGRLKLLKDQVGYSTIDLNIYQKITPEMSPESGMAHRIKEALVNGWKGLESFLLGVISIWPMLIIAAIVTTWIVVRVRRKRAKL